MGGSAGGIVAERRWSVVWKLLQLDARHERHPSHDLCRRAFLTREAAGQPKLSRTGPSGSSFTGTKKSNDSLGMAALAKKLRELFQVSLPTWSGHAAVTNALAKLTGYNGSDLSAVKTVKALGLG